MQTARAAAVLAAVLLAAALASATTTNTWNGLAGDKLWSTSGNWAGGPLTSDAVVLFTNLDRTGTLGPSGTPNSIVSADQTIQGLYCYQTNTSTGAGHTIQISSPYSLTITGSVSPVVFIGAGNAVEAGKDATNYTTILGTGSLVITNPAGDFFIRQVSGADGKHYATLDLSGLNTFSANVNRITIGATTGSGINTRAGGALRLAKTNVIVCSYTATAGQGLLIGEAQSQDQSNAAATPQALWLGQTNAIFSDAGLTVARQKATGRIAFNTNLVMDQPFVLFRNKAGTGRQSQWLIGEHATGATTTANRGTADFSYGTVDAMVDTMYVGRGQPGATGTAVAAGQGWLYYTNGIIDVNRLNIGYGRSDGSAGKGWVFVDCGAQLTVNNDLLLGYTVGTVSPSVGVLCIGTNVPGGTVWVKGDILEGNIVGGANDLVQVNGGSLKVSGTVGATNALQTMMLTNATLTFDCGGKGNPATPLWQVVSLAVSSVTANLEGSAFSVGQFSLIRYSSVSGDLNSVVLGSLPAHVQGYLSNYTGNSSIDMVITNVIALRWDGQTNGTPIGNWDVNITPNWLPTSGGAPLTYTQPSVPGDQVFFDDNAGGTTTVNLTTTLAPYGLNVNNPSKNYEFTGAGSLSGPTTLNKDGSSRLTFSNTGSNDFTGAISINGGTVQIAGSADRLPTNAVVTLADTASAALDLNGLDQAIKSLSGGGGSGGNVSLGAGTLTIQGDAGVYNGVISGDGGLVKSGSGTQKLTAANTYGGGTLISGGTLVVANTSDSGVGPGSVVVQTNGYLYIGDGGADGSVAATTITNNGWVVLNRSDDLTWTKYITGTGGFIKQNVNSILVPSANAYSGLASIGAGAVRITDPAALGTGTIAIANGAPAQLELPGGITVTQPMTLSQKPASHSEYPLVVNVDGTNTLAGPMTGVAGGTYWPFRVEAGKLVVTGSFTCAAGNGQGILRVMGNGDCDWRGNIITPAGYVGTSWLMMSGTGTWTLSGSNNINAKASFSNGTVIMNGSLLGSTNITVGTDIMGSGSTLGGTGLMDGPVTITGFSTLCGNSVTAAGAVSGAPVGHLTISNSLTLKSAAVTVLGVSPTGCDQVVGLTNVSFSGMLQVVVTSGRLVGGEAFKLFDSTAYSGSDFEFYSLPDLGTPLLSWDITSVPVDGTLRVAGSIEPQIETSGLAGDHNFQMSGTGPTNWTYSVLATTNVTEPMSNWVPVDSGTFTDGVFTFKDLNATNHVQRYYRVVTQ